jgi:predicted kinase
MDRPVTASPTLVVVSGPPGSGKTTLAHEIARALGCPAVCRDEIKEGMVRNNPGFTATKGDPLNLPTNAAFFAVLRLLLTAGVTVVAEAAFQDKLWRPGLEPLVGLGEIRVIHSVVDAATRRARLERRLAQEPGRSAHADRDLLTAMDSRGPTLDPFDPVALDVPAMQVDTTDGYDPGIKEVVAFIDRR